MKKLHIVMLILSFCTIVFAADNNEETNASLWIQSMRFMRKSLVESNKIQDLERADKEILLKMREKDFSDCEKEAARLINYIIISKSYYSNHNVALGIEILHTHFSDKNFFLDTVFDIAGYDFMENHLVLSTVLNGFKKTLGVNEDKLFKSYKRIFPNTISYMYDQTQVGSIPVINALIVFLNNYFVLVEDGKLTGHYNSETEDSFAKLQAALGSDLKKYKYGTELQKNYYFYVNNRRERGAY
jgi:hypothetical protein